MTTECDWQNIIWANVGLTLTEAPALECLTAIKAYNAMSNYFAVEDAF